MDRSADGLKQAEKDLMAAKGSAVAGHHEWAAFQAQQSGEKAVKALGQSLHGSVRGHSITDVSRQIEPNIIAQATVLDAARDLDRVYITARYPNGFASGAPADYFTAETSRRLIGRAQIILEFCRRQIS